MRRREFVAGVAGLAGTMMIDGLLGRNARAAEAAHFDAAIADQPWLLGWASFNQDRVPRRKAKLQGRWPEALRGTLYRNGPARFERAGWRYDHWFDGDGLMQAWRFGADGVSHEARMIATAKYQSEQAAGHFLYNGSGSVVPDARPARNSDEASPANTAVIQLGDQLLALWEGGSAWTLDPATLATTGRRIWGDKLESLPFSAHPLAETDGSLWNIGSLAFLKGGSLLVWRIGADGQLQDVKLLDVGHSGYVHSFMMTERELLVVLHPLMVEQLGATYFGSMRWQPERGSLLLVIDKNDPSQFRRVELPAGFAYHWADAARGSDGSLTLHGAWYPDFASVNDRMLERMAGRPVQGRPAARWLRLQVDAGGHAQLDFSDFAHVEFADWNRRDVTAGARWRWMLQQQRDTPESHFDSVLALDPQGRAQIHAYGDGMLLEEHRFVAHPQARRASQGWLIGSAMDYRQQAMVLSVFDAEHISDGPLAQARVDGVVPLGLHGSFVVA